MKELKNVSKNQNNESKTLQFICFKHLILLGLKYVFRVGYSFYQQINGTAVAMPMAQNYATIWANLKGNFYPSISLKTALHQVFGY